MADKSRSSEQKSSVESQPSGEPLTPNYRPPEDAESSLSWGPDGQKSLTVAAKAGWTVLRREESPSAEMFAVSYAVKDAEAGERPVTFVFNGGPGASSAFLHVGAIGPKRIELPDNGDLPRMPVRLVDNEESWLPWTDLIFIDPVGTGFSRRIPSSSKNRSGSSPEPEDPGFYGFATDLAALCEFVSRWLSANDRWASAVYLAGESYGGYRTARLAKALPQTEGVGLAGAILISPALELTPLTMTDYSVEGFVDTLPTMAAAAWHHGLSRVAGPEQDAAAVMAHAAEFATTDYASFLLQGAAMDHGQQASVFERLADLTGLQREVIERLHGRIPIATFSRELLRAERKVVGLYDATQTTIDPFPDRDPANGVEHTLDGMTAAFTMGVNQMIREQIGVKTERQYVLISMSVNKAWTTDEDAHALEAPKGATDDLRYGMVLSPHLQVLIVHGRHDMVTALHTSRRLVDLMRLDPGSAERMTLKAYDGGHMFYTLADSRSAFTEDVKALYQRVPN